MPQEGGVLYIICCKVNNNKKYYTFNCKKKRTRQEADCTKHHTAWVRTRQKLYNQKKTMTATNKTLLQKQHITRQNTDYYKIRSQSTTLISLFCKVTKLINKQEEGQE